MYLDPNIGVRIREYREKRGFTQIELINGVKHLGISLSQSQLSAIERGYISDPGVYKVYAIATVLQARVEDFVLLVAAEK